VNTPLVVFGALDTKQGVALKPGPHQQQCRSNTIEAVGSFVACCFDIVAKNDNNVKATFDFVESTFDFVAFDNGV